MSRPMSIPTARRRITMRRRSVALLAAGVLCALMAVACGSDSTAPPTNPTPPSTSGGTTANVTVSIIANAGSQAFAPNPATIRAGQTLAFQNSSQAAHRIVADSGAWDAGTVQPGSSSPVVTITAGTTYHCTIHPSMVGTLTIGS